ncbi:MAG: RiPP maturation radical SAM C-methyltransferase [Thermoguttaceae bacterium]
MSRVLLVNMPFFNLRWPNLGPSLLKAELTRRGIPCDMAYLNYDFAEQIGQPLYTWLADSFAFVLGGERLFARHYFAGRLPSDDDYWNQVLLAADPDLTEVDRRDYRSAGDAVAPFLDRCWAACDWSQYAVVGFAASFQQTMSSLCLAQWLKQRFPAVQIVFGGAACEGPMGAGLLRQFPEIDYVCVGEADHAFPRLVEGLRAGSTGDLPLGVVSRRSLASASLPTLDPCDFLTTNLDALPCPDFDDYFARLERSPLRSEVDPLLFFETSRGCWWGQKHHCAFCGLNGGRLSYRSKSPRRAVEELSYLVRRHGVHRACSADNILDHRYFNTFLPMLRDADLDLAFVFEMKTNLTRRHIEVLREAGMGAAQLGIETFITPVLQSIGKGANSLQNLQALKWLSETGVEVKWNVLYGFPGEDPAEYEALADLVPSLVHLAPPLAVGPVRMDRFAPFFEDPESWGLSDPRPNPAFRFVYPFDGEALSQLAYYFVYDYADGRDPSQYAARALAEIETWQQLAGTVTLRQFDRDDGLTLLTDTRPCAAAFQHRLTGWQRGLYRFCDAGKSLKTLLASASEWNASQPVPEPTLRRQLDQWLSDRLMVRLDGRYLSLALLAQETEP